MQKGFEEAEGFFNGDDQHPSMVAYKISPTEVGLRVHSRFDVSRVLNLKVKGKAQTPRETTVDGVRYFVFYDNGPDVASLVGTQSNYEYETRWPYPWVNGNSKDNNLPVSLNIYKWTKPSSWIKIDGETSITSEVGKSLAAPSVQRSQDYDGQLTWKSSNEDVVKVNPTTGAMSFVGIGTATVTVTGAETDYRLSPSAVTITIVVTEPTGISGNVRTGKPDNVRTHDLLGRRIDRQSATKGVVVVNGRKVVKK
jgi:hypothetical protein